MAWTTTLRNVAANIDEITSFATFGANIRWLCGCYEKSTLFTFPVGQTTIGTNISLEPSVGGVATMCTYILFLFVLHFIYLLHWSIRLHRYSLPDKVFGLRYQWLPFDNVLIVRLTQGDSLLSSIVHSGLSGLRCSTKCVLALQQLQFNLLIG